MRIIDEDNKDITLYKKIVSKLDSFLDKEFKNSYEDPEDFQELAAELFGYFMQYTIRNSEFTTGESPKDLKDRIMKFFSKAYDF